MNHSAKHQALQKQPPERFRFAVTKPYQTFVDGSAPPIPYVVDGLLTQGGLGILGGKPKEGKSSLARHLAACNAAGKPFLGRETKKCEVLLISLEDPVPHLDNCLRALGHEPDVGHAQIHIVSRLSVKTEENYDALADELTRNKNIGLVVIDHLAKFQRDDDIGDYMKVHKAFEKLHDIARSSNAGILVLAHCKKVQTDDPFDQIMGSTALRGVADTNLVIFQQDRERFIVGETRIGRALQATQLQAELVFIAGANVVRGFSLGASLDQWQSEKQHRITKGQNDNYEDRVVDYLRKCEAGTALQQDVLKTVTGRTDRLHAAIKELVNRGLVNASGTPLRLGLVDGDVLEMYLLTRHASDH